MSQADLPDTRKLNQMEATIAGPACALTEIGAYRVLGVLGQGGMGVVYLAERRDGQFEQRVALKVLPAWAEPGDHGRFLRERQFLARMEHKNIARLLDGGLTADGAPYFALEYVDGEPLNAYAKRTELKLRERIALFLCICDAVHYAHQHLIIHRDLKPSNVLVDRDGIPKLLDFGIAKAVDTTSEANATQTVTRLMTPAYAAPEQILGQAVSTLTDVYALGVILHELLVGERPHPAREGMLTEAQIVQDTVQAPSSRKSAVPWIDPRALRGDLDLILLTALKRDPQRRYTSVEEFAKDLRSFLDGRPIAARADAWTYRLHKLIARNRAASVAASLGALALLAALVLSLHLAQRAQHEATRAEAVKSFLLQMFESSDPNLSGGANVTARELLDAAAVRANARLIADSPTRQDIALSIATAYNRLGLFASALKLLGDGSDTAEVALERAIALKGLDQLKAAQVAAQRAVEIGQGAIVTAAERELVALSVETGDLNAAQARLERVLPGVLDVEQRVRLKLDLARIFGKTERSAQALSVAQDALGEARARLGEQHTTTAAALTELATIFDAAGEREDAAKAYTQALATLDNLLGPSHLKVLQARDSYGFFLLRSGDSAAAEVEFKRALESAEAVYGPEHRSVGQLKLSLSTLYAKQGLIGPAERMARDALKINRQVYGNDSSETLETLNVLATILGNASRFDEANVLFAESIRVADTLAPAERARKLSSIEHKAANLLRRQGRCAEALPLFMRVIAREERPDSAFSLEPTYARLAECALALGDPKSALAHAKRAYAISQSPQGLPANRPTSLLAYALAQAANGAREKATALAKQASRDAEQQFGADSPAHREALAATAQITR